MQGIWTTDHIRAAEDRLLARTPDGALMRRAAFGLAVETAAVLHERIGGVVGARVVLLVGAGNNGGDALWAGAFLRRRGVGVIAVLLDPDRAHAAGLAALRRAGGRVSRGSRRRHRRAPTWWSTASSASSAHGPLRPAAAELVEQVRAPIIAVDLPSGVEPDTGAVDGPAVHRRRHGHLRRAQTGARARRRVSSDAAGSAWSTSASAPNSASRDLIRLEAEDVADAAGRSPARPTTSTPQGVAGIAAGSAALSGRRRARVDLGGAGHRPAWSATRAARADAVLARWPEVVATGSVARRGPRAGVGGRARSRHRQPVRARCWRTCSASACRCCADADAHHHAGRAPGAAGTPASPARRSCSPRTPASSPG